MTKLQRISVLLALLGGLVSGQASAALIPATTFSIVANADRSFDEFFSFTPTNAIYSVKISGANNLFNPFVVSIVTHGGVNQSTGDFAPSSLLYSITAINSSGTWAASFGKAAQPLAANTAYDIVISGLVTAAGQTAPMGTLNLSLTGLNGSVGTPKSILVPVVAQDGGGPVPEPVTALLAGLGLAGLALVRRRH